MAKPLPELEKSLYRFGGCELDPHERRLSAHGQPVTLTPKVFDTLVLLVERAGHAVSKDELMQALWPRGYVDESNLTKHVWLIRKALDDGAGDSCIETVPKHGYRFTAAVQRVARDIAADPANAAALPAIVPEPQASLEPPQASSPVSQATFPVETPAEHAPGRRALPWLAVAALAAIAAVAWRWHAPAAPPPAQDGGIAIVDFGNLSQNPKDAWLAPALTQMLATELSSGPTVHALPDELVRSAHADLAAPSGGYAAASLDKLRSRVGADYVLSGGYLVSGNPDAADLRLDLTLQDARNGHLLASLGRSAPVADLPALVARTGGELRERLGVDAGGHDELERLAAAQPPTAEVARRIGLALEAMRRNDPARARDELLDAVAQAPDHAPTYSHLAQAWSALGYKAKALAAARQAAAHAAGLPGEQRQQIELQLQLATHDWDQAIAAARALVALRPANPEYHYQLVSTLIDAGKPEQAQAELAGFGAMHDAADGDPRFELTQARVASSREDNRQVAAHATRALEQARTRDEPGLAAEAAAHLGIARTHLGDLAGAEAALKQARADYARVGNPHGEAWVDQNLGNVWMQSDPPRAREAFQRALAGYQSIGDHAGEARAYSDLGIMLWSSGDRDGAEAAVRKALALRRETADLSGQAWALAALGTILADEAASDEVEQDYRDAIALDEQSGTRSHRAFTLGLYADQRRLRGDLDAAARLCRQDIDGYRDIDDGDGVASAQFQCALIALDRGELDAARGGIDAAEAAGAQFKDAMLAFNAELTRGQIAMQSGDCKAAAPMFRRAIEAAAGAELVSGEAIAQGLLALCAATLGDTTARDAAAARAAQLRSRVNQRQEVFMVDIALARLRAQEGDAVDAAARLHELAADADRHGWLAWSLEARLAEVQSLGVSPRAAALRAGIEADARAHGFRWVLARLDRGAEAAAKL